MGAQPVQRGQVRPAIGFAAQLLNIEHIKSDTAGRGGNLRAHHIRPGQRQRTGNIGKQPVAVRRQYQHFGSRTAPVNPDPACHAAPVCLCCTHKGGVAQPVAFGKGQPVAVIKAGYPPASELRINPLHLGAEQIAGAISAGMKPCAGLVLVCALAACQHGGCGFVEIAQQLGLPAIPDTRPDGADIDHGQHSQKPQPFHIGHAPGKIEHGARVGQVTALGGIAHFKMVGDQPGDQSGLGLVNTQPVASDACALGTFNALITTALAGIMQQDRQVQRPAVSDVGEDARCQRMIAGQLALLDFAQQAQRVQRVLVHGKVVIHVKLGARDNIAKFGNIGAQKTRLGHCAQRDARIIGFQQGSKEAACSTGVTAETVIDQTQGPRHKRYRIGMQVEMARSGHFEQGQHQDRVFLHARRVGKGEAAPSAR